MTRTLSASRLNAFLGCAHSAALWLDGVKPPEHEDAALELVRAKGFEHEAIVLADLEARYGPAVSIPAEASTDERVRMTNAAIDEGVPLIYQAALVNDRWVGFPDFLVRNGQFEDGRWSYDAEDAKLARRAKPEHVIQLGVYRSLLSERASAGRFGAIHVAGGPPERFNLAQTRHITARFMRQFETFADEVERNTRPLPSSACGQCAYQTACEAGWREADSPTFVAGLTTAQLLKLERAGVRTMAELARMDPATRVSGIGAETLPKLIAQARLQKQGEADGRHSVELLPPEPAKGFALMPAPADGDLFFDMEGDPLYPEGLEYLFGVYGPLGGGEPRFSAFWGHDRREEKAAFEAFMDALALHFRAYPGAHVYHYAAYEPVALKRLASLHATREAVLDDFLRQQRFVDLYRIARQALRASTEGYSLKQLEKIYWGQRGGEVTNAGDSIVEYERWRVMGDQTILDAIERYNENDCVSTARMRDWLEGLRPPGADYTGVSTGEAPDPDANAERTAAREAFEAERQALAARVRASSLGDEPFRDLVAELLWFHQRAQKPQWWALFDRQTWSDEELIEDLDGIGGLVLQSQEALPKPARSTVATYRFPPQETKLRAGQACRIADTLALAGEILELDATAGWIELKRSTAKGEFPAACNLSPSGPIDQEKLVIAVSDFARRVADGDVDDVGALVDLLLRAPPRIAGLATGQPVVRPDEDLVQGVTRAVRGLDRSYLVIQGPPGTGKTYTASHAIVSLLQEGARVGVASNSHKAINNLLAAVEKRAKEQGFTFAGAKKASQGDPESAFQGDMIVNVFASEKAGPEFQLVGGTVFHFCGARGFDYLVVDEAGQVALANLVAMGRCARNIVLVGDQMQLPQPVQGVHPGESGLSCLDYLMQDRATVPPDRGVLLDVSWRMHPDVCALISDAIYEGRLRSHPSAELRRLVDVAGLPSSGVIALTCDHEGCRQSSLEEAEIVGGLLRTLLAGQWDDGDGPRAINLDDVLVVAPYNAQVNVLKHRLPEGARVGTVDKFQGQEAAVVIVSMATSRGADAPRGTEFLFNRNRLNVAVSRAKCLAVVVCGSSLLDVSVGNVEDLRRLDLVARL